jgi:endonuclease YncB( thermonuclease family)
MGIRRLCQTVVALAFSAAVCGVSSAAEILPGPFTASVERVVDGDTLGVRVTVWLGQEVGTLVRIRGVDAPEMRGKCDSERAKARAAAAALEVLVADGAVALTRIEGDKYFGRVVADVTTAAGQDVGEALVAGGFARAYDGGARAAWCELGEFRRDSSSDLAGLANQD